MNAPAASITFREAMRGDVAERAHRATISVHCPNQTELGMAARCDLAAIRDLASAGQAAAGDEAAAMLGVVARLATQAVYAGVPDHQLLRLRAALNLTLDAARAVERCVRNG